MTIPRFLLCTLFAILLSACGSAQDKQSGPIVLAAASLQGSLDEVADAWVEKGNSRPVLSYAGTPALARQIEAGAPADIVFTADELWMDVLEEQQLIQSDTRRALLDNRLVLIGPSDGNRVEISDNAEPILRAIGPARLAMADPGSVPAGRYSKSVLEGLGLWTLVESRIVPTENVRTAAALVELGEAQFGIVYESDLVGNRKITQIGRFPDTAQPPIRYPVALLTSATHTDAQRFVDFLAGPEAEAIFAGYRFSRLPEL